MAILAVSRRARAADHVRADGCRHEAIGVDLVPLRDLSIVRDLVALVKALHHLGDRTAWLAVLRAPWCGVSLPTLTELSHRQDSLLLWKRCRTRSDWVVAIRLTLRASRVLSGVLEQARIL